MKDKVNKLFAALVKPHWIWYWLVFFLIGLMVFHFASFPKSRMDFINKGIVYFVISPSIFIAMYSYTCFYSREEQSRNSITTHNSWAYYGMTNSDSYFYNKINSDIDVSTRLFGYLYALTKVIGFGGIGYIFGIGFYSQFILAR